MQVIKQLNPAIVIDESHNLEAGLRIEMLNASYPCFIFALCEALLLKSKSIHFKSSIRCQLIKGHTISYGSFQYPAPHPPANFSIRSNANFELIMAIGSPAPGMVEAPT
jgi:hypothetical protein